MGNRLCKKKNGDIVDAPKTRDNNNTFDRIITRLHLRPNSWKSESQLSKHATTRSLNPGSKIDERKLENTKPLSRSTDWIEATLEVPEKDSPIHLRNPKLSFIFNNEDNGTPTPPPRKHKKGFREKIEAVAKSGLQALQSKKAVEEPLCIKKKINYDCPCDRLHRNHCKHDHVEEKNILNENKNKLEHSKKLEQTKETKRKKNLSVVSLPNFSELKFSIANFGDIDRKPSDEKSIKSSQISLPGEAKRSMAKHYMMRCRSFGSLLPQQLLEKLKPSTANDKNNKMAEIESDDSFGQLEDWDLGLIEHYNPRDASLPRPRKPPTKKEREVLSDIESLIVTEEPSPDNSIKQRQFELDNTDSKSVFPNLSSSPHSRAIDIPISLSLPPELNREEEVEHSTLMKILQEYSTKDRQNCSENGDRSDKGNNSVVGGSEACEVKSINDFIQAEKSNTEKELNFLKSESKLVES